MRQILNKKLWCVLGMLAAGLLMPAVSQAVPTISLSTYALAANTPNQKIYILINNGASGTTAITGMDLYFVTGDGGSDLPGGTIAAPKISSVSIYGATPASPHNIAYLWGTSASNTNDGATNGPASSNSTYTGGPSQFYIYQATTKSANVSISTTSKTLAVVTIDTTGFSSGSFSFTLQNSSNPSDYVDTGGTAHSFNLGSGADGNGNGLITVSAAPEPASLGLIALLVVPGLLGRRRTLSLNA